MTITYNYIKHLDNYLKCATFPINVGNVLIYGGTGMEHKNSVKKIREAKLMSKAELSRLAGVSSVTIDRIEGGKECRVETKRKIILALGYSLADKDKVFQE
jgi:DNA-binding XRE family transcriptional regulator